jgi:flagellar basal-body rod modification protein FlgD
MNTIQNALLKSTGSATGSGATNGTSSTSGTTSSATSTAQAAKDAADRFLTLLVAQLQNQDPLNPMDNAQVTTQLAQISTVSGINQLNDSVAALGASMAVSQALQAATLVGHDVIVGGNDLTLADGAASGGMELSGNADQVSVTITNAAGNVVRTIDLGAQQSGTQFFSWDGKTDGGATAPDGHYSFSITATAAGKAVTFDTLMSAKVQGVVQTSTGPMLQLPYGSQIAFAQVRQIH